MPLPKIIIEACGFLMTSIWFLCYLPQIYKTYKTKRAQDVSLIMVYMTLLGYFFGLIYIFGTHTYSLWILINYVSGIINMVIMLYFCYKYKKD